MRYEVIKISREYYLLDAETPEYAVAAIDSMRPERETESVSVLENDMIVYSEDIT